MNSRYCDITSAAGYPTCRWLLGHQEYVRWQSDGGLLWIKGKPCSGKSTLLRYAFDQRKNPTSQDDEKRKESTEDQGKTDDQGNSSDGKKEVTLSFFFHGRGSLLQKTILGFYRTVLFQLLDEVSTFEDKPQALSKLEDFFRRQYNSRGPPENIWQWETSQLEQDFQYALSEVLKDDRPVYLYVDALDECGEDDARRLAETFERMIQRIFFGKRLHICFSSRHYPLLMLSNASQICVEHHNKEDIKEYVRTQIRPFLGPEIWDRIIDKSDGVFMWAYLAVERAKTLYSGGFSKKEIEERIAEIPRDLEKLYEDLFKNMLGNKISLHLIWWICFAKGRLTLEQLRWAMFVEANPTIKSVKDCRSARDFPCDCHNECSCNVMERRVKILSHGLVEIIGSNGNHVVQFIHQSVQEFFLEKNYLVRLYRSTSLPTVRNRSQLVEKAQHSMAETCVRYCNMKELVRVSGINEDGSIASSRTDGEALKKEFPFLEYAVTSLKHADETGSQVAYAFSQKESDLINLLFTLISPNKRHIMAQND